MAATAGSTSAEPTEDATIHDFVNCGYPLAFLSVRPHEPDGMKRNPHQKRTVYGYLCAFEHITRSPPDAKVSLCPERA
jgi:hypothetical protein